MKTLTCPLCQSKIKDNEFSIRCYFPDYHNSHFFAFYNKKDRIYDTFDIYIEYNKSIINLYTTTSSIQYSIIYISKSSFPKFYETIARFNYYIDPYSPNLKNKLITIINLS